MRIGSYNKSHYCLPDAGTYNCFILTLTQLFKNILQVNIFNFYYNYIFYENYLAVIKIYVIRDTIS